MKWKEWERISQLLSHDQPLPDQHLESTRATERTARSRFPEGNAANLQRRSSYRRQIEMRLSMAQEQVQASEQKPSSKEPKHHPYRQPGPLRDRFSRLAASPSSEHFHPLPMSL
jgi:hypothetical protein